jgi:hypothetical protein
MPIINRNANKTTNRFFVITKGKRIGVFSLSEFEGIIRDCPQTEFHELSTLEGAYQKFREGMNKQFRKIMVNCQF